MDAPTAAGATLRLNISRLRKAIPPDLLATRSPGYILHVRPDELDLHRFERLMDDGRSLLARGGAGEASARVREALALWRGRPPADFADEDFAQPAIARLEEIRLAAVELRIDIDLALRELERGILRQDRELDIRPQAPLTVRRTGSGRSWSRSPTRTTPPPCSLWPSRSLGDRRAP